MPTDLMDSLREIRARFSTPEDMDDDRDTAPSQRIPGLVPGYRKIAGTSIAAGEMGLVVARAECPPIHRRVIRLVSPGTNCDQDLQLRGSRSDTMWIYAPATIPALTAYRSALRGRFRPDTAADRLRYQRTALSSTQGVPMSSAGSASGFGTNFCVRPYWLSPP